MSRSVKLCVEQLEDRFAPAAFGNPWPDATRLSLSFVPDGAQVGSQQSVLFKTLNDQLNTSPAAWQVEILRALQTWAVNGNINISVVADGGQALGATGSFQGDARFGDVRVAGYALSNNVLALSQPFDVTAGTWSGDLTFNTVHPFGIRQAGAFDVFSAILHESGHVFGISESDDLASPMYTAYRGIRTGLTQGDISALQQLYGARQADKFEDAAGNDAIEKAAAKTYLDYKDNKARAIRADITTKADADFFAVDWDKNAGGATVRLKTSGVSSLVGKLTAYDAAKKLVDSAFATDPLSGDVTVHLTGSQVGAQFYVKVESASADVFGIGSYQLEVHPDSTIKNGVLGAVQLEGPKVKQIDLRDSETVNLQQQSARTDSRFDYAYRSAIENKNEVDFYVLKAPEPPAGAQNVMTAMVWGADEGGLKPMLAVFDAARKAVSANILVNENGSYVIQIANVTAKKTYYVAIRPVDPAGPNNVGKYFLGIDFGAVTVKQQSLVDGTLTDAARQATRVFAVSQSQLSHLVLSPRNANGKAEGAVRMTITDALGKVVLNVLAQAGQTVSSTLMLGPGRYTFTIASEAKAGASMIYQLRHNGLSDPIDPYAVDNTLEPVDTSTEDWWVYAYYAIVLEQYDYLW